MTSNHRTASAGWITDPGLGNKDGSGSFAANMICNIATPCLSELFMFTATLIANSAAYLKYMLVDNLRNAFDGGDILWLAPDQAAEFSFPTSRK